MKTAIVLPQTFSLSSQLPASSAHPHMTGCSDPVLPSIVFLLMLSSCCCCWGLGVLNSKTEDHDPRVV